MRGGAECAVATMRAVVLASPGPTLTGPGPTFIAARTPVVGGRQRPPSVPGSTQVYGGDHGEGVRSEGADGRSLSGVPPTSDPTAAVLSLVDAFDYRPRLFAIAALTATLPDPLLWPLLACPWLPMDAFGTDLHLLLNLRALMCVMFCGSRVVMIATLGQMLLVCCAISSGCHVCKTGASCRV